MYELPYNVMAHHKLEGMRPVDKGAWRSGAVWRLYLKSTMPERAIWTSAACVVIRDLAAGEVVLTRHHEGRPEHNGKPMWELPGGHKEPGESPKQAAARETWEEAGLRPLPHAMILFALREVENESPLPSPDGNYPPLAYNPFYWCVAQQAPGVPTDPAVDVAATFSGPNMERLVELGEMEQTELTIIQHALIAARAEYGGPPC